MQSHKKFTILVWAGFSTILLQGCDKPDWREKYDMKPIQKIIKEDPNKIDAIVDITGAPMTKPQKGDLVKTNIDLASSPRTFAPLQEGLPNLGAGLRGADADYVDKADVYWKLNWIRKELLSGSLPENLEQAIEKTRKQLKTTEKDKNYVIANTAITHLEKGVEHSKAMQLLKSAQISTLIVPWRSSKESIQRFIESGGLGFGKQSKSYHTRSSGFDEDDLSSNSHKKNADVPLLTTTQKLIIETVLLYAEKYHASPQEVMSREWQQAIERINYLRDELGLMKRETNKDGDNSNIPTDVTGAKSQNPRDLLDNAIPISPIKGSTIPEGVPKEVFLEPANPFKAK